MITIDVLSKADSVKAQGVGSVYLEQCSLIEEFGKSDFSLVYNSHKKCDLYHIHSINPSFYLMMKKKRTTIAYVHFLPITLDGSISLPKPIFAIFKKYVISFYRKAKELVVVNPTFISELVKLGIDKNRITYIPNFVSEKTFHPLDYEKKSALRYKYNIPEKSFVVLSCGQIQNRKGVKTFLDIADKNKDIFFIWAGGFPFKNITDGYKELKNETIKKRDNVLFLGIVNREEMNDIYNLADLFFMPSYSELFPMALLEACSCNLPYLVRDIKEYQEILLGDYLKGDDDTFSFIIRKLKDDKSYYDDALYLSKKMKEYYSRKNVYSLWKKYYKRIYDKYQSKSE